MTSLKVAQRYALGRFQKTIELPAYPRGCHVITRKVYEVRQGQMQLPCLELALLCHYCRPRAVAPPIYQLCRCLQALPELSQYEMGLANIFSG